MSDLKTAKDSLVASLFELSKAAQDAAAATVNFYKLVSDDTLADPSDALQSLGETLKRISEIEGEDIASVANAANVGEKPKKKKAERDPNAPKKPLTIYFAFAFHTREVIREQRKREGKPALSAIDMNELVKDRWNNISKEDKEYWQTKYAGELKAYQKEKEKYKQSLDEAQAIAQQAPVAQEVAAAAAAQNALPETLEANGLLLDIEKKEKEKKKEKKRKL
ncbi:uncharacterized protein CANTADRAFT_39594, partial [Suhomyces tanzawaensis NRRL Y-17324]